jgi:hypothetical protein
MHLKLPLEELIEIASAFRKAIESIPASERPITLREFPVGSCGDASLLLGTYLIELGENPFDYMLGDTTDNHADSSWSSHAWIQREDLIIDITADQFSEIHKEVIVSTVSEWHRTLSGTKLHIADFNLYDNNTITSLLGIYRHIKTILQGDS